MNYTAGPLVLILSLIMLAVYWKRSTIKQRIKSSRLRRLWDALESTCSIRINNWWTSVVLPIVLVALLWFWLLYWKHVTPSNDYPGFFFVFMSITFTPLFEEVLFRGVYFGFFFLFVPEKLSRRYTWLKNFLFAIGMLGVLLTSLLFSFTHNYAIDSRYVTGVLFVMLYWIDKRNLLPAIIAHTLNNIISVVILANNG